MKFKLPFYITTTDPKLLLRNQQILQSYLIAACRLMFITPEQLLREQENETANQEFISQLYGYGNEIKKV